MARDISVSIAVQGEKEFDRALKDAQSAVKVLASELKASEAAFDESADAQAYYANKTRNISDQIEQQRTILASLEQAVREAGDEFGESSAKTDKYRIAVNKTYAEIAKLERSLRDTQQEAEELGRDSTRIGRQMEEGIGDAADDVSDKLERMVKQIKEDLGDIGGAVEFSAMIDAGQALMAAGDALASFTEDTEDYRRQMSFLEQNAADSGFDFEYIKEQLFNIASLTGDADGAFEAISNLMAAGFDGNELEEAIDLIGGAVIRFPETMKFENLAESLQESVSTRSATGAYAELLERLGVDLDTVNQSLADAKTNEEAQQIALAYLNENGLKETVDNYKKVNEDLIANETAQLKFNDAMSKLGESLSPAAEAWTNFKTGVVTGITDILGTEGMVELETKFANIFNGIGDYFNGEGWAQTLVTIDKGIQAATEKVGAAKQAIDDVWTSYQQWNDEMLKRNEEAKKVVDEAVAESTAFDSLDAYNEAIAQADAEGAYVRANALVAERDKFLKEQAQKTAQELDEASKQDAATIGGNISTSLGNGIIEEEGNATQAADSLWQKINSLLSREIEVPVKVAQSGSTGRTTSTSAGSYATGGEGNTIKVITEIDSETVAQKTVSGVSRAQGQSALRAAAYG